MVDGPTECSSPAEPTSSPPPRPVSSGTTTNPNTPRLSQEPEVEDDSEPTQDLGQASPDRPPTEAENIATTPTNRPASPSASPSPKSSSSGAPSLGHIEPTWPKKIDLTKIPALASWGEGQSLPGLLLDLHWVPSSNKAFLELRASVQLKHAPGRRRDGRTSVYLHIYPERITQLSLEADPADKMLGHDTVALAFTLCRPPALVVPPTEFEPRNRASGDMITALFDLARQTSWTVYAAVSPRSLSASRLRKLCEAVSEPLAGSIAAFASAATLYQGQGGKIVEGDSLAGGGDGSTTTGHKVHDDNPPKYEESGSAPVLYQPGPDKGKKRLRRGSTPETSSSSRGLKSPPAADMESLLESRLSALEQRFGDALASHKKEMVELVGQAEARIVDTLRGEMGELESAVGRRVREEVAELEETVMRNISEAPLRATLTFPQHPWY